MVTTRRTDPASGPWAHRLREPGWLLLPLRGFLGVTFVYAGLQKLANPDYLDRHSPASVVNQMRSLRRTSPIGPLLGLSTHAPVAVGLLIAFGELAVGLGALLGLWTRLAAAGGMLLALTFFLTVSWNTSPYYYGSDIVFVFAWLTLLAFGTQGVCSLETRLRNSARRKSRLGREPATVAVSASRLRALCARGRRCGIGADGRCERLEGCPVFPADEPLPAHVSAEVDRRAAVARGTAALLVGVAAAVTGTLTAVIGRWIGGTRGARAATTRTSTTPGSARSTVIAAASSVPVGGAVSFTDPKSHNAAWLVHPSQRSFVAFSAICTHAGCAVQYDGAGTAFICPCHGGVYDARSGRVLQGPPPQPLPEIPVRVVRGKVRVDG
ncbi:MAG: TQO small subunit DoxD [Mycobacteriales bacterium]